MKTNFEHLQSLDVRRMAIAIWNYASDYCAYCPKNMERRCNENCRAGVREWLNSPYTAYAIDVLKKLKAMIFTATPGTDTEALALPSGESDEVIEPTEPPKEE